MEERIRAGFDHNERGLFIRMSPQAIEATCTSIHKQLEKLTAAGHTPIVLVSPQIRAALKQITENHLPQLVVLSFNEVTRDTQVVTLGLATDT
jgi:flagellar biosynthesis protein FlhA